MEEHNESTPKTSPAPATTAGSVPDEALALQRMIAELSPMQPDARRRIVDTVCTFFGLAAARTEPPQPAYPASSRPTSQRSRPFRFSDDVAAEPSPKQFMHEKSPATDVERVACLAYYLAHVRGTPHFQTKDITQLNTEAAQRRFSNTAVAVDNASKTGYLVPSVKGHKQLSAAGERFVEALPDRQTARQEMERSRPRRGGATTAAGKGTPSKD